MGESGIRRQLHSLLVGKPGTRLIIIQILTDSRCRQVGLDNRVIELQSLLCCSPGFFEGVSRSEKARVPKLLIGTRYATVGLGKVWVVLKRPFE